MLSVHIISLVHMLSPILCSTLSRITVFLAYINANEYHASTSSMVLFHMYVGVGKIIIS